MGGFAQGWQTGEDWASHAQKRQTELSDEERETKLNDYNGAIQNIQKNLGSVAPGTQEHAAYLNQLSDAVNGRTALFHPSSGPGALAKLGALVFPHLAKATPAMVQSQAAVGSTPVQESSGGPMQGSTLNLPQPAAPVVSSPAPTPQSLQAQYAQTIGYGAPRHTNPLIEDRKTLSEAGVPPEDIATHERIGIGVEAKPIAHAEQWVPDGSIYQGKDGKPHQMFRNKYTGETEERDGGANWQPAQPKPSTAALASYLRAKAMKLGIDENKLSDTQRLQYTQEYLKATHPNKTSSREILGYDANGDPIFGMLHSSSSNEYSPIPGADSSPAPVAAAAVGTSASAAPVTVPKTAGAAKKMAAQIAGPTKAPALNRDMSQMHKNTAAQTDATKLADGSVGLMHRADNINTMSHGAGRALEQNALMGMIQQNAEKRFNQAAYDNLFKNLGYGNSIASALEKMKSGELPPKVWKAVYDLTKETLDSAGAVKAASYGKAPALNDGAAADAIPATAAAQLQEGVNHTFGNKQVWTKKNGIPVRVK